jgi:hypothetical protein
MRHIPYVDIVGGTRIVEQLYSCEMKLTNFMYYGNFFVGKLWEPKHPGERNIYRCRENLHDDAQGCDDSASAPAKSIHNLEFNAHFLDIAREGGLTLVECLITFFQRLGQSNRDNV